MRFCRVRYFTPFRAFFQCFATQRKVSKLDEILKELDAKKASLTSGLWADDKSNENNFVYSHTKSKVGFTNWKAGQPNNHICTLIAATSDIARIGKWFDSECGNKWQGFVCQQKGKAHRPKISCKSV